MSTWPFRAWNRAEVIGFNRTQNDGPLRLYAYNERHGWNPYIEERRRLEVALAEQAVGMVFETEGAVGTSKCPMPRHAVVLYDGDAPVASINVCFECGDLLIWPDFDPTPEPEPDLDSMTEAEYAAYEARIAESMRFVDLYENEVFPRWVTFFRDRVGMPIGALYDPASSDQKEQ